jgi:protein-S-isoprenylcysteine O-methyltransferase Ste14
MLRGFIILFLYIVSLFFIPFISAGQLDWLMAWISLGVYSVISVINFFLVDPELVVERAQMGGIGVHVSDKVLATVSFLFFYPLTLLIAGLDVGRYSWSPVFPLFLQLVSLLIFAIGNIIGSWAMVSNKYFSTFMRIQDDRGHEVVSSGPYEYIRHPGYAGSIIAAIALPLCLGSVWALFPALIGAGGFVIRTVVEDNILLEELGGYEEYAHRVRYRLVPGIW